MNISFNNISHLPDAIEQIDMHLDDLICGIILIERETRTIVYVNSIASKMIQRTPGNIVGHICHHFVCPADEESCPIIDLGNTVDLSEKLLLTNNNDLPILKKVKEIVINGKEYLLESFTDISAQKQYQDELKTIGETDSLTGLLNRTSMNSILCREVITNYNKEDKHTLLMLDIDHFKHINDTYGHDYGDIILKEVSVTLLNFIRNDDKVFRWGGEEFLIWLKEADIATAFTIAERLRTTITSTRFPKNNTITVSIGIAEYSSSETFEEWFKSADQALIAAKQSGRNMVMTSEIN